MPGSVRGPRRLTCSLTVRVRQLRGLPGKIVVEGGEHVRLRRVFRLLVADVFQKISSAPGESSNLSLRSASVQQQLKRSGGRVRTPS